MEQRFQAKRMAEHAAKTGSTVIVNQKSQKPVAVDRNSPAAIEATMRKYGDRVEQDLCTHLRNNATNAPTDKRNVIFMGRDIASGYRFRPDDVCISITDTHAEPPQFFHPPKEVLHRGFHDHVTAYDEHHFKHRWAQIADGEAIVDFVLKHTDSPNIIVHCNYGQSRSKAAALAIAEFTGRNVLYANRDGRIVAFPPDGDEGNYRVRSVIMHAHMDREEA
ncbi:hypothetical protein [Ralstonia phage RP31]|uniref:Tyrosine specific protein phosphatases domain-containing protein n=2 Tax=Ripduovirus RP12 TaxID=2560700 RepID=A0A1L7N187_9CAUD|nr:hypothetical protein FDH28_gp153 [Ralstonia phage RP12]BAW19242.1 hypothetical protein [Ralstonia phage RP12]BAW19528.1 hypothetical protein [Ralstonia phage RP31]